MNANRAAFSFDRDFSNAGSGTIYIDRSTQVPVASAEHRQAVEAARAKGREEGLAEGRIAQKDADTERLATCLDRFVDCMRERVDDMRQLEEASRREALDFALHFAKKLAGRLIENAPMQPIEATARAIFNDLRGSPHLAIRVAPALVDTCKTRLALLLRENGLELKLFVFPDPEIAIGDARVEWADGGIVRDRAKLEALIEQSLDMLLPRRSAETS